ncbi:MAG: hypothetical protein AB8B82_12460 [Roseovarius sp.]
MAKMSYTATIECDGVISEPLEIEVELQGTHGTGQLAVPPGLVGVVMNASTHATVRTDGGDEFKILFSRVLFPECVAEFETAGAVPQGRRVA